MNALRAGTISTGEAGGFSDMLSRWPRWPERILGPAPGLAEINLVCWGCFLAFLVVPLGVLAYRHELRVESHDRDFVYFYGLGRILNEYPSYRLYDYALQKEVFSEIHPLKEGTYGPSPYPPIVAMAFRPLAGLNFPAAYGIWLLVSLVLYSAGLHLLGRLVFAGERLRRSLLYCLGLSFGPFVIDTLFNGQLAAIAFFAFTMALQAERVKHHFIGGIALSLCLYKPTLLVLVLPMMLVTGRWRMLAGFALGGASMALLVTLVEGIGVWSGYFHLLMYLGNASTGLQTRSLILLWKYIDFSAFSALLPGGRSLPGLLVLGGFSGWAASKLVRTWWRSRACSRESALLVWAPTITWTLLLNIYVPIYDSILIVISVVITVGAAARQTRILHSWISLLWVSIAGSSWITQRVAENTSIQIFTILVAVFGLLQLSALGTSSDAALIPAEAMGPQPPAKIAYKTAL
jgi:hypothetical protein